MPFTIPNQGSVAFTDQAQIDAEDFDILVEALSRTAVTSGCAVTSTGAANGSVTVAAGTIIIDNLLHTVAGGNVQHAANATGNPRYDLVVASAAGALSIVAGTAAASPVFPAVPTTGVVTAVVRIPNGHTLTSTITAGQIVDKRAFMAVDLAANSKANWTLTMTDPAKIGLLIKGVVDPSNFVKPIWQVDDYQDAPIAWVGPVSGLFVTDDIQTAYTVFGDFKFRADVYGYQWRGKQCSYTFGGPPGNILEWNDAVHEVYQSTRLPTVANWGVVAACTRATVDLGAPPTGSPTTYRTAIRITNTTGATAWLAQPGGASARGTLTAGEVIAPVYWIKSASAAAARNAQVRITWYNAGGTQVGADITSGTISVPNTGVWTRVSMSGQIVPATATRCQMHILLASLTGETHDIAGCGLMLGDTVGTFAPPFVAQNDSGVNVRLAQGAFAGDRWLRTDEPSTPGAREYICVTPGVPGVQRWQPLDTSDVRRLSADQPFTTTSLANVVGWSANVVAGREYQVDVSLPLTSAATTTGWQVGWTGPTMSSLLSVCEYQSSATAWTTNTITSTTMPANHTATAATYAANTPVLMRIRAHFVPSASGVIQFQARTSVAASAITAKRGATMQVL